MYNSNFRRCGFGCFGTGRCRPQSNYPMKNRVESRPGRDVNGSVCSGNGHENSKRLLLKSSSFGGLVLPEGMAGEATYHVAALNLDTSGCKDFLVLLNLSCNITANVSGFHLRFQMFKQEKCQPFPVPVSSGVLYTRAVANTGSDSFTLSACDRDSMKSPCCSYSVQVEVAGIRSGGTGLIANPVLIATIMENN